ncbi:MAG: hypothetical protein HY362_00685 [Candidatus Aenigmarchaeota archaeon]|nr:hypothetical protein [Candidatus Aenigmarchaeota archaeon]
MKKPYSIIVGRFQPFHLGHLQAVLLASKKYRKVGIGIFHPSFGKPNKTKVFMPHAFDKECNPFPYSLVKKIVFAALKEAKIHNFVLFKFYPTMVYPFSKFKQNLPFPLKNSEFFIAKKGGSNKVMKRILEAGGTYRTHSIFKTGSRTINGTEIRRLYFSNNKKWEKQVPPAVRKILLNWRK